LIRVKDEKVKHPFFEDYAERLNSILGDIRKQIEGLSPEALNWVPGSDMNSLAVLVTHTSKSTWYWVDDMVTGADSGRVRSEEFEARAENVEELLVLLDSTIAHCQEVLESMTLDMLAGSRYSETFGDEIGHPWALLHGLDHAALHLGHIEITRQLWDQRQS
jgi:hypothetical protein